MLVPNRHASSNNYRYGFQGQEKDDELKGEGNSLNYTFRMHDPRVGRFFAVDPLAPKYPFYSPYHFSSNSPISSIELEGLESSDVKNENEKLSFGERTFLGFVSFLNNVSEITGNNKYDNSTGEGYLLNSLEGGTKGVYELTFEVMGVYELARFGVGSLDDNIDFKSFNILKGLSSKTQKVKTLLTVTNKMSLTEKINVRQNFVLTKFASAIQKYGIEHINWTKKVYSQKIKGNNLNGNRIVQWRDPSNPNPSPFFTFETENPNNLGIPKTHTQKYYVDFPEEYDFLTSTAAKVRAFSDKDPGINGYYNGGGTQLYAPEAAKNAKFTPAID